MWAVRFVFQAAKLTLFYFKITIVLIFFSFLCGCQSHANVNIFGPLIVKEVSFKELCYNQPILHKKINYTTCTIAISYLLCEQRKQGSVFPINPTVKCIHYDLPYCSSWC